MTEKIHYLNPDVLIPIEVSGSFLQRIQKLSMFMIEDKTEEELEILKEHFINDTVPADTWMYHYETVAGLIKGTEDSAIKNKLVQEKDITESDD
jgi:hypothetical protein